MIFGLGKKAKAKSTALEATRTTIAAATINETLPPGFWTEPYTMGVIFGMAGTVATLAAGGQLSSEDKGSIIGEVHNELAGATGLELPRALMAAMQRQDPDFVLAAQRAARLSMMMNERAFTDNDAEVMTAKGRALAARALNPELTETQAVLVELSDMWIAQPLRAAIRMNA